MREYDYWLAALFNVSNEKRTSLVDFFHGSKGVYNASTKALIASGIVDFSETQIIANHKKGFDLKSFNELEKSDIKFLCINDNEYPKILKSIYDAPFGLFIKGVLPKSFENCVAIVGARKCSAYGRLAASEISKRISERGGLIISGMARGIDGAAHSGALLANKPTVAVLGCGVDICYPADNKNLYDSISQTGCIISEYLPKTPPLPHFFPLRNRIISGLSKAVIVIEAALKSGSLITADQALEQGRDVYALPGRITDKMSAGSNKLIEQGAGIICSIDDLVKNLGENLKFSDESNLRLKAPIVIQKEDKAIYDLIGFSPTDVNELLEKTNYELPKLLCVLNRLLSDGIVKEEGRNRYVRNRI